MEFLIVDCWIGLDQLMYFIVDIVVSYDGELDCVFEFICFVVEVGVDVVKFQNFMVFEIVFDCGFVEFGGKFGY